MPDCAAMEAVRGIQQESGELLCDLEADHEGLHYDAADNIWWKVGESHA